jgi:ABC-type multidrug transport system ATPase subunit
VEPVVTLPATSHHSKDASHVETLRQQFLARHDPSIMLPEDQRLSLEWKNITYKLPIIKRSFGREISRTDKNLLDNISGFLPAGSLLGIMGPSGAGKTTFLNVLSRQLRSEKISGQITVNGSYASRAQFKRLSGFVAQDDVLMGSLTPEEALLFAANLKLPDLPGGSGAQLAHVRTLLRSLGLEHVKDQLIGYTGAAAKNSGLARGLSGGERKRVSIAFEMVSNPQILFLDEPTSGLDSFAAKTVMDSLRDLAFYGRTIVATIHSPSAEIFRTFDYLLLLGEGQTVYFGPAHLALRHFASMGMRPPRNMNPADFMLKAIHVEMPKHALISSSASIRADDIDEEQQASQAAGLRTATHDQVQKLIDSYKASSYAASVAETLGFDENGKSTSSGKKSDKKLDLVSEADADKYVASYWRQFWVLVSRAWTNTMRDPALLRAKIFQAVTINVVAGLIWLRLKKTDSGAADRYSAIFFVLTSAMFGSLNGPIYVFPSERAVFFREKASNMYSTILYYLATFAIEFPPNLIIPFLSTTIFYWMVGFNDSIAPWLVMCAFAVLLNIVGHGIGMFLSCAVLDTGLVLKLQPLVILPVMLFSGFFLNTDSVPKYFIWLEALSFLKYSFRATCVAVFSLGDKLVFSCPPNTLCRFSDGASVLKYLRMTGHPIYIDALILIGMTVGIHILAVIALALQTRRL